MTARQPVVIVGAGLAGMLTALSLAEPCILVCPSLKAAQSSTGLAQGGVAAAIGAGDDATVHLADTLAAGDGLIAELLIRDDAGYSAVRTVTRARMCEIVGVAVRPERETIPFHEDRAEFREGVHDAAVSSTWFGDGWNV